MATPQRNDALAGSTALITGAAKRLGAQIATTLAAQGVNLLLHCRHSCEDVESLAKRLTTTGIRVSILEADLASQDSWHALWEQALQVAGAIDHLINNASVFPEDTLETMAIEDLFANLNVNALAPFILARAHAAQGRQGSVVNLLDARIVDYDREHAAYHLSKRMLFTLTRMMAIEFAPLIRVNAVAPGLVLPPVGKDQAYIEALAHTNPLNAIGTPDDVAEAVLFLLRSRFVTGQVIFVDGGRHMRGSMYGC